MTDKNDCFLSNDVTRIEFPPELILDFENGKPVAYGGESLDKCVAAAENGQYMHSTTFMGLWLLKVMVDNNMDVDIRPIEEYKEGKKHPE